MGKIVVMVADELSFLRTELRQAILQGHGAETIEIIECDPGVDGNDAVAQIDAISPDVVLLDINFPHRDGLVLCRKIVRSTPQTKVVMLTSNPSEDDDELFEAIKSGASAYVMTQSWTPQEFTETIERASRGEYPINDSVSNKPQVALRVQKQFEEIICNVTKKDDISTPLNPKEVEILAFVVKGKANKEIGAILGITESAVKKHISSILRKLNANDRAHAVVLAVRNGLVAIEPNVSISRSSSDALAEVSDTMYESNQTIEEARNIESKILADAEEIARQLIEEAKRKGEDNAGRMIAEAENGVSPVIEKEKSKDSEKTMQEEGRMSKLYDGVVELAIAPPVNVSTLCALHKQLKQTPNIDVLSMKGAVNEGLRIRMLVRSPLPLLEFIKGLSAVKDASDDEGLVQSQIEKGVKRIVVTTC
jgi:DNA-binding NarL/FixJ family response regulator/vacuolar-type H+-ATPase subunit H